MAVQNENIAGGGDRSPVLDRSETAGGATDGGGDSDTRPEPQKDLTSEERRIVVETKSLRAAVIYEIIRTEGEGELRRDVSALWWSGVVAGLSIAFSFITPAMIAAGLPAFPGADLVAKAGYAVGFLMVILGGQQLFTENVLTAVLPAITHNTAAWWGSLLRLWSVVLAANISGCLVVALFIASFPVLPETSGPELQRIVLHLMENSATEMFIKGIGAGWVIAALVWMLPSSQGSEFVVIALMTYLIALFEFTHIVAGSAEVIYGWYVGIVSANDGVLRFFLPTLAGNIVGGTVLFTALSYAQVRKEIKEAPPVS
ncbi:MAG: formate/nitrite transporter family protein [Hyphomicrobiaceae bacterium]|nr:formate/nitrite transporter family protein [Hyphomicrobiaceae bacterium]